MKNLLKSAVALVAVSSACVAMAGPKSLTCPYCKMKMMTTKSKGAPVPVKVKGTTYYCCTSCHPAPKKK